MVDEPKRYVLDSFALLAYFGNEPGAETVEQLLRQAQDETVTLHLSLVNLGEVYYITQRERGQDVALATLASLINCPSTSKPLIGHGCWLPLPSRPTTLFPMRMLLRQHWHNSFRGLWSPVTRSSTKSLLWSRSSGCPRDSPM